MDISLFEKVTKIENDELIGLKIDLLPEEYKDKMKAFKKEFNELVNKINVDGLKVDNLDNKWQSSGYFKKYFWSKIFFKDTKYLNKDLCLWLGADIDGLNIYLGTSDDFSIASKEDVFKFVINKIDRNKEFKNFKIDTHHHFFRYTYTGDNNQIDEDDFIKVIEYLKPIYKMVLDEFIHKSSVLNETHENSINIKNIILYGAPGVGKTHNYKNLISMIEDGKGQKDIFDTISKNEEVSLDNETFQTIKNEKRVEFVTFHQSYSYEDFIEGFRPNNSGNIELENGIFKNMVEDALKDDEKNYYLVIDEINRGNISKIFGELITLIEEDKRDAYEVTLPYSKKSFKVSSNLYIIATMDSTDKSIATIDIALRRRFTFLKMKPKSELVKRPDAKELMEKLNFYIGKILGEDYKLGHSYFMKIQDASDLEFVKEYKIKPLLEEYFYADEINYEEALKMLEKQESKEDNE